MRNVSKLTIIDKGRIKWAIRNGWSAARIAIVLTVPLEHVYEVMAGYSGPEIPMV